MITRELEEEKENSKVPRGLPCRKQLPPPGLGQEGKRLELLKSRNTSGLVVHACNPKNA
jgi:hypothetical protein